MQVKDDALHSTQTEGQVGMKHRRGFTLIALAALTVLLVVARPGVAVGASPVIGCPELTDMIRFFYPGATITSATVVSAKDGLAEHCKVEGWRWPDDGFIIKLPTAWNERLFQVGNGGAAGTIAEADMVLGLSKGFATAGGSGGHRSPGGFYQFGYFAGDASAYQKVVDYCSGSVHAVNNWPGG